jgi:hypothetical protein
MTRGRLVVLIVTSRLVDLCGRPDDLKSLVSSRAYPNLLVTKRLVGCWIAKLMLCSAMMCLNILIKVSTNCPV